MNSSTGPVVLEQIAAARTYVETARRQGLRVGLIPTMGALHAGHLSLVAAARAVCDRVVVTIFVNPTQFAPHEDLARYPRTWDDDLQALTTHQTDLVFAPTIDSMYPPGASTRVCPPDVARTLEGEFRPDHFQGVATVVLKLFQILPADVAFFGEKDFQQCLVVRDMVRDLDVPIQMTLCPTVREADGLALSSRNRYLTAEQRQQALGLSRAWRAAEACVAAGERQSATIERCARQALSDAGVERVDYVALRDVETLAPLERLESTGVLLIAAHVGSTRLIDNRRLVVAAHVPRQG